MVRPYKRMNNWRNRNIPDFRWEVKDVSFDLDLNMFEDFSKLYISK